MAKFIDLDTGLPALLNKVKAWVNSNLATKQDTLTFDNAPTAGSNNPVKSGGIKTALDGKANVADVPTNQDMADAIDDALGEAQVTVVPASSVGIISSLGSDSDSDALSASMGKKLKVALITILSNLGEYAFPNGKPTIDWGGDSSVTYSVTYPDASVTKVTHGSAPDSVNLGDQLEVTLGTNDDLYVVKDSSVKVFMGGVEQSGAYNASTQKVTLAAVTANVVIVAEAWTYVSSGLVFHLDCKHLGGQSGHWIDLVGGKDFTIYGASASDAGVVFDGVDDRAECNSTLQVLSTAGSIEFVIAPKAITNGHAILFNGYNNGICAIEWDYANWQGLAKTISDADVEQFDALTTNRLGTNNCIAGSKAYIDGVEVATEKNNHYYILNDKNVGTMLVGCRKNNNGNYVYAAVTVKAIRVYNKVLTEDEYLRNYKIDKQYYSIL